jgi:hypothetical protein
MKITQKLLKTIAQRVNQVFFAKTSYNLDTIELYNDGTFYCCYSKSISYGGTETINEIITAEDLTTDLNELTRIQEEKEKIKRQEQEKLQKEIEEKSKEMQKAQRLATYNKLKKEFEP